ncbi:recombinase family protein [Denitromonas halophila]|nr:recombinase family protein [Denitromonas halophila]
MSQPRVYSYLRFSDPRQSSGDSSARQAEYARRWAAERGLVLDDALSMRDEGLSAYHQRHVSRGALGVFLAAVDDGHIAAGSVLIVEGLDRLSRAEPIQAQAQLAQIINAGITVVTASDGREYNRESLKAQPMDLVYSLLVMIRAHEESDTKSKRVRAAIRRQCEGWLAGTYRGAVRNGSDPAWVRWTGSAFELIPERAEAIRMAIGLFRQGNGAVRIAREMTARGVSITGGPIGAPALYKTLRVPALMGVKRIEVDGEAYALAGYYPALLTPAEFDELQHLVGQRKRRRGRGEITAMVTGMGITFCGYCGSAVAAQNLMTRPRKADGTPQDGHRRLICNGHSHGAGCDVPGSCSVVPVERAILTYCSDQINLTALMAGSDPAQGLRAALATTRAQIAEVEKQIERVTDAMLADDGPAPIAFARKARDLESQLATLTTEATATERELAHAAGVDAPAAASWAALAEAALAMDEPARQTVRQLVADTFERIAVYARGFTSADRNTIGLVLVAKGGGSRALIVDRRSGAWRAQSDAQL